MAERQFGPYRLVRQIAVGGMAEIHLARAAGIAGFEKYVALKMIHPNFAMDDQFIQMLVDEAKIAVQLTHGNIAQTFDLGRVGETYYITMEYVDGADLYKILRRASEQDLEMPLDVCAFIGKEISSALDHAHRKRDHTGKSLGIVHRDVSPQNVLVSYSGEVKLVDFGIAKATMKARQTAVGVIKGKYYYMSPEQAWGDPIDHRSDIFSAGIVLYEMITGQMLYLEEDLQKLLEMARSADIAPPSQLRRGVPPQLERIVMHALERVPGERYQSAGDLATDLERFLHAYSPVFTASKLSTLLRQVIGEPVQVPDDPPFQGIEFRDGVMSTHPLDDAEVAHAVDRAELRDENSVIFRVSELQRAVEPTEGDDGDGNGKSATESMASEAPVASSPFVTRPSTPPPVASPRAATPRPATPKPAVSATPKPATPKPVAPRVTRPADPLPLPPLPARPAVTARLPSIIPPKVPSLVKPRAPHEETRKLDSPAPADPLHDDSGLLTHDGGWDDSERTGEDFENVGERTLVTAAPGLLGFMVDVAGDFGDAQVEATLVTTAPIATNGAGFEDDATSETLRPNGVGGDGDAHEDDAHEGDAREDGADGNDPTVERSDDDLPTLSRGHPTRPRRTPVAASAALSAKIHAPAISELRKPRASRRTPAAGSHTPSVLQAIVGAKASEPMPAPRPPLGSRPPAPLPPTPPTPSMAMTQIGPQDLHASGAPFFAQPQTAGGSSTYDASGLPLGIPTPPGMPADGADPLMPYLMQGYAMPPQPAQGQGQGHGQGYLMQMSPAALYPFQQPPQAMSLTGQLQLSEVDEIPSHYRLGATRQRWFTYIVSGVLAVSVAAVVTFLVIRSMREQPPPFGSVHVRSVPSGAEVRFDGTLLIEKTPTTIPETPVATRHTISVELPHRKPHVETVEIPKTGGEVVVTAELAPMVGKLVIDSNPEGAEIWISGQLKGRTPKTISELAIESATRLELRLKDYQLFVQDLKWPPEGRIDINAKLVR